MAEYSRDKYVKEWYNSQKGKQFVADKIISDQRFEKKLAKIYELETTAKEKSEKDVMLEKGISYAYSDIEGKGLDACDDEDKKHTFFVKGYDIGNRRRKIEGMTAHNNHIDLSIIPEKIRKHHKFIEGYAFDEERDKMDKKNKHR